MEDYDKHILIVDDDKDILDLLSSILEEHFYSTKISTAMNGLDAFLMSQKEKFDLIISDHQMPFMTGAALIVALRTRENLNQKTELVMLSGFIDEEMKKNLNPQKVTFLSKPFDNSTLINLITPHLI